MTRTPIGRTLTVLSLAAGLILLLAMPEARADPPGCSDRSVTGSFVCTIDQPNVTQHETAYPNVQFAPGDIVDVQADGCVQTGGIGDTWKRYVNPTGGDVDHLYHGLIRIPSATPIGSGLVRIGQVIGHRQTVTGAGVPLSQLFLHLGYEDDGYGDNGYDRHDDGNDDQCKNDQGHGGPARVWITVFRAVPPSKPTSRFAFDVLSPAVDRNMLPLNPHWAWQQEAGTQGQIPSTSICHNFSKSDTVGGIPSPVLAPNFPDCTDQADASSVDLPDGLNAEICRTDGIFKSDSFAGHVNWFPITVEGHAGWGDHSADDDYTFTFQSDQPGNPLSVNGRPGMHVEFDSEETIDRFASPEWATFHANVDSGNQDLARQVFDGHTILTGMFGLDGEHNLKSELHPLFALATRRDNFENDPRGDTWLIFVRNRGDEGFCSSRLWDAGFEDYTFRLPWLQGMASASVNWNLTSFEGTDGTSGPMVAIIPPPRQAAGIYVTFHLGPASNTPFIDGTLHLIWVPGVPTDTSTTTTTTTASRVGRSAVGVLTDAGKLEGVVASEEDEVDEAEHRITAAENQLAPAQRRSVQLARTVAVTRPPLHLLQGVQVQDLPSRPPTTRRRARPHAIDAGPASEKLQRDRAQIQALCAASNDAPAGLPPNLCVAAVRDHR